jgi:hypothetical protein
MNQRVEARTIQITSNERVELFLVELDYLADCFTQSVQQFPGLLTIKQARHGLLSSQPTTSCSVTSNCFANITLVQLSPRTGIRVFILENVSKIIYWSESLPGGDRF